MKKQFKRILSLLMAVIVAAAGVITARADIASPPVVGDVDRDFKITILDATAIQKFLASIGSPDTLDLALADADADGRMTILDATALQKRLASLPSDYQERVLDDYYLGDIRFHSDAEIMTDGYCAGDEVCYVGIPVVFTIQERYSTQPHRCSLIIDGKTVEQAQTDDTGTYRFSYTFSGEGTHTVVTRIENRYQVSSERTYEVHVLRLPDDGIPVIVGAAFYDASRMSSGNGVLTVHAENGAAPYEYCYAVYYTDQNGKEISPFAEDQIYSTGFTDSATLDLRTLPQDFPEQPSTGFPVMTMVRITVRDAKGALSLPVTVEYIDYEVLA